ncbi:Hsp70 family protein [Saccharothrix coeruleofusca]|uniref:Molecular chaperone DnaK n=1 Tax=Saccharothrix coeruleofusca TaxID=33919 RepID=A0A918AFP2_9PSEU|nr:Hsp70 family protein [Saccharothrix coeruleofusca]MBP2340611.1 molecular chaperone DnaK (HSP70) [Saccharothrix coeruleofusca]GGP34304.1 molecular chaperone DnaK [Saccharothrix coeruleofusca]
MPYVLGVDVGTTRTAAAVCRLGGAGRAEPEVVGLGGPGGGVASFLQLTPDGTIAVGEPGDPRRTATGFLRRVGDEVPVVLGSELCAPEELTALMVAWVARQVADREGERASHVVLTHPPGWGPHAKGLVHGALRAMGLPEVTLLAEPLAAAENHVFARGPASTVGVFSMGSHAFSAALVRRAPDRGFELLSWTEGVDQDAGADFDDAVLSHVRTELGRALGELDAEDPRALSLLARLRRDCEAAKRVLSGTPETAVPVHLPTGPVEVVLTRARFEELIRPAVEQAVESLRRTCRGTTPDAVVLVGGSARIPLIAASVPGRVALEAAPETSVVKGAALAARRLLVGPEDEPEPVETSVLARGDDPRLRFPVGALELDDAEIAAPPPRPPVEITPLDLPERRSVKRVVRGFAVSGRSRGSRSPDDEDGR